MPADCCYCHVASDGKIVLENQKKQIIANHFCKKHMNLVCKHTIRRMKTLKMSLTIREDPRFMLVTWYGGMPTTMEFLQHTFDHAQQYQNMVDTNEFRFIAK